MDDSIKLDGSHGEGGGQILRIGVALSAVLGRPIRVDNVRGNRPKPGLRAQHVAALEAVGEVCGSEVTEGEGAKIQVGSAIVTLVPNRLRVAHIQLDTKTAGSSTLICQALLPCLLFAEAAPGKTVSHVEITGGTDAEFAPPVDFMRFVLLPFLAKHVLPSEHEVARVELFRRGFFPVGGGRIELRVAPAKSALRPLALPSLGTISSVTVYIYCSEGARQAKRLKSAGEPTSREDTLSALAAQARVAVMAIPELYVGCGTPNLIRVEVLNEPEPSAGKGACGMLVVAESDHGCVLSGSSRYPDRGVAFDEMAKSALAPVEKALQYKACVDEYLQDQLIIFMALASGSSQLRTGPLSLHTKSAIEAASAFGAVFTVQDVGEDSGVIISCSGLERSAFLSENTIHPLRSNSSPR